MNLQSASKAADKALHNPVRFIIAGLLVIVSVVSGYAVNLSVKLSTCTDEKDSFINKQNDILNARIDNMLNQKLQTATPVIEHRQDVLKNKTDSLKNKTDSIVNVINKIMQ